MTLRSPEEAKKVQGEGDYLTNVPKVKALAGYWNYSWGPDLVPNQPGDMEFVPMTWRAGGGFAAYVAEKVKPNLTSKRIKRVLGFNEPDGLKQANMTYMQAIEAWPALMELGIPLCSPSPTHCLSRKDAAKPEETWMQDFMGEAEKRGYRVDYVGVHSYGGPNANAFKKHLQVIYEAYGKRPLLITEFAVADWNASSPEANKFTPAQVLAFMKDVIPWMEKQEWIAGYCWFSFKPDSKAGTSSALFDKDDKLTACGRFYKSVSVKNPEGDQTIAPEEALHKK